MRDSYAKIEDPPKYVIEQVAEAIGLNKDGNPKAPRSKPFE